MKKNTLYGLLSLSLVTFGCVSMPTGELLYMILSGLAFIYGGWSACRSQEETK